MTGNSTDNIINGGIGNDTLSGIDGNDEIFGGDGADTIIGGDGEDTVSYSDSSGAMTFNLATGVFSGIGAGDSLDSIEVVSGTSYGDTFIASINDDLVNGSFGTDLITYA